VSCECDGSKEIFAFVAAAQYTTLKKDCTLSPYLWFLDAIPAALAAEPNHVWELLQRESFLLRGKQMDDKLDDKY
jgi:hypothetical protein